MASYYTSTSTPISQQQPSSQSNDRKLALWSSDVPYRDTNTKRIRLVKSASSIDAKSKTTEIDNSIHIFGHCNTIILPCRGYCILGRGTSSRSEHVCQRCRNSEDVRVKKGVTISGTRNTVVLDTRGLVRKRKAEEEHKAERPASKAGQ
jgi:hypothetical protein